MNTDTGKVYTDGAPSKPETIAAAEARGEHLVAVGPRVAQLAKMAREVRLRDLKLARKRRARARRRNRR